MKLRYKGRDSDGFYNYYLYLGGEKEKRLKIYVEKIETGPNKGKYLASIEYDPHLRQVLRDIIYVQNFSTVGSTKKIAVMKLVKLVKKEYERAISLTKKFKRLE